MLFKNIVFHSLLGASWARILPRQTNSSSLTEDQQLELDITEISKIATIANNGGNTSFVFDFNNPPKEALVGLGSLGNITSALGSTFPEFIGVDAGVILFELAPCSLVVPHLHPRADEIVFMLNGSINTTFVEESGAKSISNKLNPYQMTMFTKGSIHYELNNNCEKAVFVSFTDSNDPGVTAIAPTFLGLNDNVTLSALGGLVSDQELQKIRASVPAAPIVPVQQCLQRCGQKTS
jgi:hypothetical protein